MDLSTSPTRVPEGTFCQGLLLATCAAFHEENNSLVEFLTNGKTWIQAWEDLIAHLHDDPRINYWLIHSNKDPIGGVYDTASILLRVGEHDLILGLSEDISGSITYALFLVSSDQAAKELKEFQNYEWFVELGRFFASRLKRA